MQNISPPGAWSYLSYDLFSVSYLVYRGHIEPVEAPALPHNVVNTSLGLGHLARTSNLGTIVSTCLGGLTILISLTHLSNYSDLDILAAHHDSIHLVQRQLSGLRLLELHEGEPLVFAGHRVPGHRDATDRPKR